MPKVERVIQGDLTIWKITGRATVAQVVEALEEYYAGTPTRDSVWDMTDANALRLSTMGAQRLVETVKPYHQARAGGKTAIIAPGDLEFGMGKVVEAFIGMAGISFQFKVFRNRDEAAGWLGVDTLPLIP